MQRIKWIAGLSMSLMLCFVTGCNTVTQRLAGTTSSVPVSAQELSISPQAPTLSVSQSAVMKASVTYSDGSMTTPATVIWSVNSPEVATISAEGVADCLKSGTTGLTAQASSLSTTTTITCVGTTVVSLSLLNSPSLIRSDSPFQYHVIAHYGDGTTNDVTSLAAISADTSVAAITNSGLLLCNYPGTATLIANYAGASVTAPFSCVVRSMPQRPGFVESAARFEGPFNSWQNVKTAFGAVGDGVHDDSVAFQNALDSLASAPAVLWLPRGTYVVTKPLRLTGVANVMIVGEDPLTTTLIWKGGSEGTLLTFSGCMGLDIGRLTLDGSSEASELIELTWDDISNYYPTRNLIHDSRLINAQSALHTGWAGETTVDRVHFDHNTVAGVSLGDWNALNFNIVDSLFTDNALGVTNVYGAGAFNVSNSVFERSTVADISIGNTGPFAFRNNLSVSSERFLQTAMTGAPASITVQGNAIYHPTTDPIVVGTPGSLMLIDNTFLNMDPSMHIVTGVGAAPLSFVSVANTYPVTRPYGGYLGLYTSFDETTTADVSTLPWSAPTEIYIPQPSGRPVYDISPRASGVQLQAAINEASVNGGTVHLPAGIYHIDKSIAIPTNASLSVVGDGALTDLVADPDLDGPILAVSSGLVDISNLELTDTAGSPPQPLLELRLPDQPSSRVECDECATIGTTANGIQIDGLDQALIEFKVVTMGTAPGFSAEVVHGGALHQESIPTLGRINNFMASMSTYSVDQGAVFLTEDGWHDTGQGQFQLNVGDSASVTQQGGTIYVPSTTVPFTTMHAFSGTLNLLGTELNSFISTAGASDPSIFIAGAVKFSADGLVQGPAQGQGVENLNNWSASSNSSPTALESSLLDAGELEKHLAVARSQSLPPRTSAKSGNTEIHLSRLITAGYGVHVTGAPAQTVGEALLITPSLSAAPSDSSGCASNEASIVGAWQLRDGLDGSVILNYNTQTLGESVSEHSNGTGASLDAGAFSARDRWIVTPAGDGTFELINRATGDALTSARGSCAYTASNTHSASQHWAITSITQ